MVQYRLDDQSGSPARHRRKRGATVQAIGRSRGGNSTKVHLVVDALGLPVEFAITEGQRHDVQPAPALVKKVNPSCLLGDKAYDSNSFRDQLSDIGCIAVIPCNGSRATRLPCDKDLYKARSMIECTFNLMKQARRFATRYEKTVRNYGAIVVLACVLCWLRV